MAVGSGIKRGVILRTLRKNKQKMYYALQVGEVPIYETDEYGNIIYTDDGTPIETGEYEIGYASPVEFSNGISGKLSEVLIEAFGINDTSLYAQMDYMENEYPFEVGTLIWKKSEIEYKDSGRTMVEPKSADYEVAGIVDEFPNQWSCLLKRKLK